MEFALVFMFFWIIFIIFISKINRYSTSSKNSKSKKKKYLFRSLLLVISSVCLFVFFGIFIWINLSSKNNTYTYSSADGFTIEKYDIVLNVKENNKIEVEENIIVNFYNEGHHGIYRFIPTWLEYTGKDEKTISRKSKIIDLKAIGEEYSISTVKGKKKIKIGSADVILPTGDHQYKITYTYDQGQDPYTGFDEFIFHAFGDYWGTRIKNATVKIIMPKKIDGNIKFFADKYRKTDITRYVDYRIDGNTIVTI